MIKTAVVTIDADNRDHGRTFLITEWPAYQAEAWASRVLAGVSQSGIAIPEGIENAGLAGLATLGMRALSHIPHPEFRSILDEMLTCVQVMPSPDRSETARPLDRMTDIEEVSTLLRLRVEVLSIHMGFMEPGILWGLILGRFRAAIASWTTLTSPEPLAPSSPPASRPSRKSRRSTQPKT